MSDFFLPTLFVVDGTNALPTTNSTPELTAKQLGFFDQNYVPVTAANVANAQYIYGAQGRIEQIPGLGTKRTDKMYRSKVIGYWKVPSISTATNQVTEVSEIHAQCEDQLVLTIRLFSNWIELGWFNGKTVSYTISAGCCECGADICADVDAETIVDQFIAAIEADTFTSQYIVPTKEGTGADAVLVLTGQAIDRYGNACSPTAFTYEYDRLRFDVFAYKNPDTTQDYIVADACDVFATVAKTADSNYTRGIGDEVFELEKKYFGYHTYHKSLFRNIEYDGAFQRYSVPTTYYDLLYIRHYDPDNLAWELSEKYDQEMIVAVPTGSAAATSIEALLTAFVGRGPDVIAAVA